MKATLLLALQVGVRQIGFAVRHVEVWSSPTDGVREMLRAESSAYEPGRMTPRPQREPSYVESGEVSTGVANQLEA